MKQLFGIFLFLILVMLILTCANQGFPPGGPEDKSPPFILQTFPPKDTTNVPLETRLTFLFSEPVIPSSCEDALFITPFPGENIKYKWKRDTELSINFGDSLLKDRTYVVTIGAGTKDRRNNAMQNSFTLAFSTGDVLDKAQIGGRVYGDQVEGTQIWAYDLSDTTAADPTTNFPLYITQAGKGGRFQMTNMALGDYRLFAILDRDVNNKYNIEYDMLGVSTRDVRLDSATMTVDNFNFRTTLEDTTAPMLNAAMAPDEHHVDIRFTESMLPDCLSVVSNYIITTDEDSLPVINAAVDIYNAAVVHLTTARQDSSKEYKLAVIEAYDVNHLPMLADSNFTFFKGSAVPDTNKADYLTMQPRDSSKFVRSFTPLSIYFSKAMDAASIESNLVVADTLGDTISGIITWPTKSQFTFTPDKIFASDRFYLMTLPADSIFDWNGNAFADTLFQRQFTSVNPDTFSAISGSISDADTSARGPFFMLLKSADAKKDISRELWLHQPGPYTFDHLLPDRYTIQVFRDEDENGRFSYGQAFPYQPAERFWVYPDTVEIRSRWPTEGEDIILPW
jgi:hypothetical protein